MPVPVLRDYQQHIVTNVRQSFASGKRRPLMVLPTGAGKTVSFAYITHGAAAKGNNVTILVHREELLWQTSAELERWGVKHCILGAGMVPDRKLPVMVATVQTLARRLRYIEDADLIIIDEAHHAVASTWLKVLDAQRGKALGVTATAARPDGKGLGKVFDDLIIGPTSADLMKAGFLAGFDMYAPPLPPDLSGVKKLGGDYKKDDLAARMSIATVMGCAVDHYRRLLDGKTAIAFCVSINHANAVAAEFRGAGYRALSVDGTLDKLERRRRLAQLRSGEAQIITSCELISEGLDVPGVQGAILLRPTMSLVLYLQQIGRALRPKPDGSKAIILDHAGNSLRHGLPDAVHGWSLEEGIKRNAGPSEKKMTKNCGGCQRIIEIWRKACPKCGWVPEDTRKVRQVAGELCRVVGFQTDTPEEVDFQTIVKRARSYEALQRIAQIKGYKPGWAYVVAEKKGLVGRHR